MRTNAPQRFTTEQTRAIGLACAHKRTAEVAQLNKRERIDGTGNVRWECMGVRWIPFTLGAMVVAAVMAVDPGGLSPFGPGRWWLVSTLCLVGGGAACWTGSVRLDGASLRLWVVLLGLLGVSALINGDVAVALLGHPVRHLGLITWWLFALVFAAGQQLGHAPDRQVVLRAAVLASLGLGSWTMWELLVGPPVALATDSDRLAGPFGSAAFLGAACCLLLPVGAGVASDAAESRRWRTVGCVGATMLAIALVGSGTRAAWIGLGVALATVLIVRRPARRLLLGAAGALVLALALLAPRLDDVVDRANGTASRLDEWAVAARIIGDQPLLGAGPEGYRIAAAGAVDADYERDYGRDRVLPDRAHSGPLDVTAVGGLLAGVVYVVLVGGVVLIAMRTLRSAGPSTMGLCVGIIAYAGQQLLLFPLSELDPVWWLFAGMLVAATSLGEAVADRRSARLLAASAFVLAPIALVAGVLDVAADRQAHRAVSTGDVDDAVLAAERAVDLRPDDLRYRAVAIEVHRERGTLADIDAALVHATAALDWSPDDPIALDARATLLLDRATITGLDADTDAALAEWQRLVEGDPVRARWRVLLGRAAALAGNADLAGAAWAAAAELRPDDPDIAALLAQLDAHTDDGGI